LDTHLSLISNLSCSHLRKKIGSAGISLMSRRLKWMCTLGHSLHRNSITQRKLIREIKGSSHNHQTEDKQTEYPRQQLKAVYENCFKCTINLLTKFIKNIFKKKTSGTIINTHSLVQAKLYVISLHSSLVFSIVERLESV